MLNVNLPRKTKTKTKTELNMVFKLKKLHFKGRTSSKHQTSKMVMTKFFQCLYHHTRCLADYKGNLFSFIPKQASGGNSKPDLNLSFFIVNHPPVIFNPGRKWHTSLGLMHHKRRKKILLTLLCPIAILPRRE